MLCLDLLLSQEPQERIFGAERLADFAKKGMFALEFTASLALSVF